MNNHFRNILITCLALVVVGSIYPTAMFIQLMIDRSDPQYDREAYLRQRSQRGGREGKDAKYELNIGLEHEGRLVEAEKGYREFLREYPDDRSSLGTHFRLGRVYAAMNRSSDAIAEWNLVLKQSEGKSDKASVEWRGAAEEQLLRRRLPGLSGSERKITKYKLDESLEAKGELIEAAKGYREFLKEYPDDPLDLPAHYHLGKVDLAIYRTNDAIAEWNRVIQLTNGKSDKDSLILRKQAQDALAALHP